MRFDRRELLGIFLSENYGKSQFGLSSALHLIAVLIPFGFFLIVGVMDRLLPVAPSWTTITLYDWQRIGAISVLILSLLVSLLAGKGRLDYVPNAKASLLMFVVLLAGIFSVELSGHDSWSGWREVSNLGLMAAGFVFLGNSLRKIAHWQSWTLACLAGSALLYVFAFLDANSYTLFFPEFMGVQIFLPGFSNVRFLSDYQAFVLPFFILAVGRCQARWVRWAAWVCAFLFVMVFYYSGSRVMALGQVGGHLVLWIVLGKRYGLTFFRHLIAWIGGYALFLFLSSVLPYWLGTHSSSTLPFLRGGLSLREVLWEIAWMDIVQHPWLGIGPGEFSRQFNPVAAAPHNGLLMLGAEWGAPIMLLAALFILRFAWLRLGVLRSMTFGDGERFDFAIASWLAFAALFLHSLVANVWVVPTSQLAMLLSAVLLWQAVPSPKTNTVPFIHSQKRLAIAWIFLGVGSAAWMMTVLASELPRLPGRNQQYIDCPRPTPFFSPRFWQQGWLINQCLPSNWDSGR